MCTISIYYCKNIYNLPAIREEGTRATPGVSTVPSQDSSDKIMQIEKLGELKDKGLLTEEEFQKEKDKIL